MKAPELFGAFLLVKIPLRSCKLEADLIHPANEKVILHCITAADVVM